MAKGCFWALKTLKIALYDCKGIIVFHLLVVPALIDCDLEPFFVHSLMLRYPDTYPSIVHSPNIFLICFKSSGPPF